MKKNAWLVNKAHIMAAILIIIQPIMDVVSYWMSEFGMSNTPTLLLRMGVLAVAVLYAFVISDKKHVYLIAAAIMAAIYAGHVFACMQVGFVDPIDDFANYIRVIQMPLLVMVFITFMRRNDKGFDYMQMGASVALLFMFAVEIISTITGTDPHTYGDGVGVIGWFFNTNSQSSNLCTLAPILFIWQWNWKKRRPLLIVLSAIASCLAMYMFATRLAYLGVMAFAVGLGVMIPVLRKKDWKYGVLFIALAIVFAAMLPISPAMTRLRKSENAQAERQEMLDAEIADKREDIDSIISKLPDPDEKETEAATTTESEASTTEAGTDETTDLVTEETTDTAIVETTEPVTEPVTEPATEETTEEVTEAITDSDTAETEEVDDSGIADVTDEPSPETTEPSPETTEPEKETATEDEKKLLIAELTPIYEKYVGDFVRRFGAEKTMQMYDYTLDVKQFASLRAKKLMFAEMLMQDSPFSARLFGVEISRFYFEGSIYDVENDFHGIYFLYGSVGFAAYMLFIAYFVLIIIKALIKDFKKYFTLDAVAYGISAIVCLIHCYNTAGVLRRPNASVYLSVVFAAIYYLIYIRKYNETSEENVPVEENN